MTLIGNFSFLFLFLSTVNRRFVWIGIILAGYLWVGNWFLILFACLSIFIVVFKEHHRTFIVKLGHFTFTRSIWFCLVFFLWENKLILEILLLHSIDINLIFLYHNLSKSFKFLKSFHYAQNVEFFLELLTSTYKRLLFNCHLFRRSFPT